MPDKPNRQPQAVSRPRVQRIPQQLDLFDKAPAKGLPGLTVRRASFAAWQAAHVKDGGR